MFWGREKASGRLFTGLVRPDKRLMFVISGLSKFNSSEDAFLSNFAMRRIISIPRS
jgi:hypothetical protein